MHKNKEKITKKIRKTVTYIYLEPNNLSRDNWPKLKDVFNTLISSKIKLRTRINILLEAFLIATVKDIIFYSPSKLNEKIKNIFLSKIRNLPFAKDNFDLIGAIGSGYTNKIFLFQSKIKNQPSFVVKIPYRLNFDNFDFASNYRNDYLEICSYFQNNLNLVLEENMIIVEDIFDGKPIAITTQKFEQRELKDIFEEVSQNELIHYLSKNKKLQQSLQDFLEAFENHPILYTKQLDITGKKNLSLAIDTDSQELILLDAHYEPIKSMDREIKIRQRIKYLEECLQASLIVNIV